MFRRRDVSFGESAEVSPPRDDVDYSSVPNSIDADKEEIMRNPYTDERQMIFIFGRFLIASVVVLTVFSLGIWAFVIHSRNSDDISYEQRRRNLLEDKLWEKCTPNLDNSYPPIAFKDRGTYIFQDPGDIQFGLGWTTPAHECSRDDPDSTGYSQLIFDQDIVIDDHRSLTISDPNGLGIRPSFSLPAYLTQWTGPLLYYLIENRCSTSPAQEDSIYLVLQADGTPIPCTCLGGSEYCYQYPGVKNIKPVFLNSNKEVP